MTFFWKQRRRALLSQTERASQDCYCSKGIFSKTPKTACEPENLIAKHLKFSKQFLPGMVIVFDREEIDLQF